LAIYLKYRTLSDACQSNCFFDKKDGDAFLTQTKNATRANAKNVFVNRLAI